MTIVSDAPTCGIILMTMEVSFRIIFIMEVNGHLKYQTTEALFLVMCDPTMNELRVT